MKDEQRPDDRGTGDHEDRAEHQRGAPTTCPATARPRAPITHVSGTPSTISRITPGGAPGEPPQVETRPRCRTG